MVPGVARDVDRWNNATERPLAILAVEFLLAYAPGVTCSTCRPPAVPIGYRAFIVADP